MSSGKTSMAQLTREMKRETALRKIVNKNLKRQAYRKLRRARRPLALKTHSFVERRISEQNLPINGSGFFTTFQLDDCYNKVSYSKLFEYYKLDKIIVEFAYKADGNPSQTLTGTNLTTPNEQNPMIYFKVDHNDITNDTLDVMKASARTRKFQFTNNNPNFTIQIKPAVQDEVYKSAVASTYVPKWGQWLTMNDLTVPHYGLKCYAVGPSAQNYGVILITMKYYFSCKNND